MSQLPLMHISHCDQSKKLNASMEKSATQYNSNSVPAKNENFSIPMFFTVGVNSFFASSGANSCRKYGCTKPISVSDDVATPGVLENASTHSPMAKLHSSTTHRG